MQPQHKEQGEKLVKEKVGRVTLGMLCWAILGHVNDFISFMSAVVRCFMLKRNDGILFTVLKNGGKWIGSVQLVKYNAFQISSDCRFDKGKIRVFYVKLVGFDDGLMD